MFRKVNLMVGHIVKVTSSSKMVGDHAIFMVKNDLTPENILEMAKNMAFPDSVVSYLKGMMGQPEGGFPDKLQKLFLKGEEPISVRPGELLPPEDFDRISKYFVEKYGLNRSMKYNLSYALYPDVYEAYINYTLEQGILSRMGSDIFFHGLSEGEICEVEIEEGKTLIIQLLDIGTKVDEQGRRTLDFEINGNRREIKILDKSSAAGTAKNMETTVLADPSNKLEIDASPPGTILKLLVSEGQEVKENQSLIVIEAMKMETNISAPCSGIVESIFIEEGQLVKTREMLVKLKQLEMDCFCSLFKF